MTMHRTRKRPFEHVRDRMGLRRTLAVLFTFAVLLQFGYPITLHGAGWTVAYMLLYSGMLFFALLAASESSTLRLPLVAVGALSASSGVVFAFFPDNKTVTLVMLGAVVMFMTCIVVVLGRFLFRRQREDGLSLILAALTVYVILGGLFGGIYAGIELLFPGSFSDPLYPDSSPTWVQLVYFSYVAMSTIGFGDVLATTPWSRTLVTFQGVSATLFLTIVVARLVGTWSTVPEKSAP